MLRTRYDQVVRTLERVRILSGAARGDPVRTDVLARDSRLYRAGDQTDTQSVEEEVNVIEFVFVFVIIMVAVACAFTVWGIRGFGKFERRDGCLF